MDHDVDVAFSQLDPDKTAKQIMKGRILDNRVVEYSHQVEFRTFAKLQAAAAAAVAAIPDGHDDKPRAEQDAHIAKLRLIQPKTNLDRARSRRGRSEAQTVVALDSLADDINRALLERAMQIQAQAEGEYLRNKVEAEHRANALDTAGDLAPTEAEAEEISRNLETNRFAMKLHAATLELVGADIEQLQAAIGKPDDQTDKAIAEALAAVAEINTMPIPLAAGRRGKKAT